MTTDVATRTRVLLLDSDVYRATATGPIDSGRYVATVEALSLSPAVQWELERTGEYDSLQAARDALPGMVGEVSGRAVVDMSTEVVCSWFARCENAASDVLPHPALTAVAICDRCKRVIGHD